ncbi:MULTISPECIES: hypothetical protein [Streptacidiphilus]|uniref:Lipoprotein n=1 Tax=Streptacidiphilus cavernicola TaxID=3342716 RepID=A0ABV6UG59_9ACTN|nr:hypothetical protein [Streptacidiphilus jeojiense]
MAQLLRRRRLTHAVALMLLGLSVFSLEGCNPDPTDPENVDPITLANNTSGAVRVFWCASDWGNVCSEKKGLGRIPAGATRQVHISSYEVVLYLTDAGGSGGFVCEDNAPGNRIALDVSYPSMKAAYDHCIDGPSAG